MVEFSVKVNPDQRVAYFPRQLCEALGFRLRANSQGCAVLMYSEDSSREELLASLQLNCESNRTRAT